MHTWLQSQPSLTHCGGTCSRAIQVKVNASERQTYVFISIILHNNTGFFGGGGLEAQKRENRCNKRSPSGMRPYLGKKKSLFISRDWTHVMWLQRRAASTAILEKFLGVRFLRLSTGGMRLTYRFIIKHKTQLLGELRDESQNRWKRRHRLQQ